VWIGKIKDIDRYEAQDDQDFLILAEYIWENKTRDKTLTI